MLMNKPVKKCAAFMQSEDAPFVAAVNGECPSPVFVSCQKCSRGKRSLISFSLAQPSLPFFNYSFLSFPARWVILASYVIGG
jgi:hypothetical protein